MDEIAQEVERPSATEAQRGADALDQKLAGWRTADPCRVASQNIMWYTHTRCAHSPQTVGGSTCSAVIKPSVTSAHSSIHAHRVAGVTAESERGSAEVRCHGMQSMSGTTAIVSVTSRSAKVKGASSAENVLLLMAAPQGHLLELLRKRGNVCGRID